MIYRLKGELLYSDTSTAVIDVNGIAFECAISMNTFQQLGSLGSETTLYTYMNFKQDGVDLIGFHDRAEKDAFQMLIGVSKVGPKVALAILSELDPSRLSLAILAGDYKALTRAKGVGAKAAQRIVIELKDKLAKNMDSNDVADTYVAAAAGVATGGTNAAEAVEALVALGYSQSEAAVAVGKCDQTLDTSTLIMTALKQLN